MFHIKGKESRGWDETFKTDVRIHWTWNFACFVRRIDGCLFLYLQRPCICQCTNRKYFAIWNSVGGEELDGSAALSVSNQCFCGWNRIGRYRTHEDRWEEFSLAPDLCADRGICPYLCCIFSTEHEHSCKQSNFVCVWNPGGKFS